MKATRPASNAHSAAADPMWICKLGLVGYGEALAIQRQLAALRVAGKVPDTLLLLEHPPVYTRGRRAAEGELALGEAFYRSKGIEVLTTDRGGRVTYHGPGQLVGYPIMRVGDVLAHLRQIESAIIDALAEVDVQARSRSEEGPDWTGVWVQDRKIASIGVHVARGVSTHGFAVNVTNDLTPFSWIVPCGLAGVRMTSIANELGVEAAGGLDAFAESLTRRFCAVLGRSPQPVSSEQLPIDEAFGVRAGEERAVTHKGAHRARERVRAGRPLRQADEVLR